MEKHDEASTKRVSIALTKKDPNPRAFNMARMNGQGHVVA
jgi:hypothetical protein